MRPSAASGAVAKEVSSQQVLKAIDKAVNYLLKRDLPKSIGNAA